VKKGYTPDVVCQVHSRDFSFCTADADGTYIYAAHEAADITEYMLYSCSGSGFFPV